MQAQPLLGALCRSPWFLALPGPARQLIVHKLMARIVRKHVWAAVQQPVWEQRWEEVSLSAFRGL